MGDVDSGGGCACGGGRWLYVQSLYLPLSYAVNPNSKKIKYKKICRDLDISHLRFSNFIRKW